MRVVSDLAAAWAGAFAGARPASWSSAAPARGHGLRRAGPRARRRRLAAGSATGSAYGLLQALARRLLAGDEAGHEPLGEGFAAELCRRLGLARVRDLVALFRDDPGLEALEAGLGLLREAAAEGRPTALALCHEAADELAAMAGRAAGDLGRRCPASSTAAS
ncbi:MAG: hypothetical protein R3F30_09375 [Planctomycetota bacterium]